MTKPMKLELMYGQVGKRLMLRSICFSLVLALMPLLYIVQDAGPCDLSAEAEPFYNPGGPGVETRTQTKIWAENQKVEFYSGIYRQLMKQGLLRPGLKGLCVGGHSAQAVLALKEIGVPDVVGIDRGSCKGKFRRLPFARNSFDFVFSGSLEGARAPALFALEFERMLKPNGVAIMVVSPRKVRKNSNAVHSLNPIVALFRNSDVVHVTGAGNCSVIALRKRAVRFNPLKQCSPVKHNRTLVELAEPLTEKNSAAAIYLPSVLDITPQNSHVYVQIGVNDTESSISGWFLGAYPKQNKAFQIYAFGPDESGPANLSGNEAVPLKQGNGQGLEIGGWMKKKINSEDFVVVRVGFPYVKGLIDSGAICLIDELFVVCSHHQNAECMQLLRSLRKNGVFAHKWQAGSSHPL